MTEAIATLISAGWIVPVEPYGVTLVDHSLAINEQGKIIAVLPTEQALQRYTAHEHFKLPNQVLLPGLVNLHAHSAMTLLRGLADDLALMDWLNNHIWPAEAKHVSDEFVLDGTLLAMSEMLRGGTTTVNDMYFFHDAVARAGIASRMRTIIGGSVLEFPTPFALNADEYIRKFLQTRDTYQSEPLLGFSLAPHAPYTVSDDTFRQVITLAEQLDITTHCHIHETQDEIQGSLAQHGSRPLARLKQLGLLTPSLTAAHMVHLQPEEIALAAEHGISVAHNPSSNLKLGSGFAPVADLLAAGVNVGIGTDGAASNNKLDMFAEMRLAALLAKGSTGNPQAVPAAQALQMATLNGARALGLAEKIGSLVVGKQADVIAVDLAKVETTPIFDPISHLVYAAGREQVTHVWVAGECLLHNRALTTLNAGQLQIKAKWWRARILAK
jgi:5-methylthioadenosine/S-adenosylhomocysteine deaminase